MFSTNAFSEQVFQCNNENFSDFALRLFYYQYSTNPIYRAYVEALRLDPLRVCCLTDIPFLPISFFKTHRVTCGDFQPELVFESSGTTGSIHSRHYVKDAGLYLRSCRKAFEALYGPVSNYVVIGLLPAYLERPHSSLVYMVNDFIRQSGRPESGFYLYEHAQLFELLQLLEARKQKTLLIGVSFALLDFAEKYRLPLQHTLVMETGGMKGRREEWTREQVHDFLKERLNLISVHAEYGMTELLSQAYAPGNGLFECPPWMKVLIRDEHDPLRTVDTVQIAAEHQAITGLINVIDLANIHSCAFIATEDIGKGHPDGRFEVLGRMDNSALRGCSLMVS